MVEDDEFAVTPEQQAQAALVHSEVIEMVNRLLAEGMEWRVVLGGLGSATVKVILDAAGPALVPVWFLKVSAMTFDMSVDG